jgi:antitoxin VapB
MAFSIKNPEAELLARQLAEATGESLTEAVIRALRARLHGQNPSASRRRIGDELALLAKQFRDLPVPDTRSADEILGYDSNGLPT